jgi:BMFP domain-containing protein YqiC
MSTTSTRFFDELAKVMTNAAGAAQGARREVDNLVRAQIERVLADIQVVQREEFDVVRDMAAMARTENETLRARVAELEARLASLARQQARHSCGPAHPQEALTRPASAKALTFPQPIAATRLAMWRNRFHTRLTLAAHPIIRQRLVNV